MYIQNLHSRQRNKALVILQIFSRNLLIALDLYKWRLRTHAKWGPSEPPLFTILSSYFFFFFEIQSLFQELSHEQTAEAEDKASERENNELQPT